MFIISASRVIFHNPLSSDVIGPIVFYYRSRWIRPQNGHIRSRGPCETYTKQLASEVGITFPELEKVVHDRYQWIYLANNYHGTCPPGSWKVRW